MNGARTCTAFAVLALLSLPAAAQQAIVRANPQIATEGEPVSISLTATLDGCDFTLEPVLVEGDRIRLEVFTSVCTPPRSVFVSNTYEIDSLPAGAYTIEVAWNDAVIAQRYLEVVERTPLLVLHGGLFEVEVTRTTEDGLPAPALVTPLSHQSGFFWFFSAANTEVEVKILDGRPVNGHWWVFVSSKTDRAFTVQVNLVQPGSPVRSQTYTSRQGANQNFIDTTTF